MTSSSRVTISKKLKTIAVCCLEFFGTDDPMTRPLLSILSALQPWVSFGLLNNQSPLLSIFHLLHPLLNLHYFQVSCNMVLTLLPLSNPLSKLLSSTSLSQPSEADCWVSEQIIFTVWSCQPHAQPPTWRTRLSLFVWVITLDLSDMGGPTSSICYHQHSFRFHMTTQAPLLRQSRDTFEGRPRL